MNIIPLMKQISEIYKNNKQSYGELKKVRSKLAVSENLLRDQEIEIAS